ncbi:hypothetical protein CXB51_034716 [Gossypium anomalum]|uniref:Lipoxygenase domain-containing protein n=1 Tax=Gossypium anomalum TaxID=47600 RepID=A0A8J5Y284_9ROSI|nr:hypothetical protein CXB51_034716 [Gossypium anomalum]
MTDEEFTREMLAGVNPVIIRILQEFPPTSNLDPKAYGNQNSAITKKHIEHNLEGLTVEEDKHYDNQDLRVLNHLTLNNNGTLKPLVIELTLPHLNRDPLGAVSKVYTPAEHRVEGLIWLNTHATMEPFMIATNRQLSVVHPIYKLLYPHFQDTMNINAFARKILINRGGVLELMVFPRKHFLEISRKGTFSSDTNSFSLYLESCPCTFVRIRDGYRYIKLFNYENNMFSSSLFRGVAIDDMRVHQIVFRFGLQLKNGSEIIAPSTTRPMKWSNKILNFKTGGKNSERRAMATRKTSHGGLKCRLEKITSALYAAVNFGQYPYGGYLLNHRTISHRFMPEKETPKYVELESNLDKTLFGISLIEILSRHSSDEVYLGQRTTLEWTSDETPLVAFDEFRKRLSGIEERIVKMNNNKQLKNSVGPIHMPYTLLYPTSGGGLTGKGIPNSVSI